MAKSITPGEIRKGLGIPDSQGRVDKVGKLVKQLRAASAPAAKVLPQVRGMLRRGIKPSVVARVVCGATVGLDGDLSTCTAPLMPVSESRSFEAQKEATEFRTETPPRVKAEKKPRPPKPPKAPKEKKPKVPRERLPKKPRPPKEPKAPKASAAAPPAPAAALPGKRGFCPRCGRSIPLDSNGRLEPHTYVTGEKCPDGGELPKILESWESLPKKAPAADLPEAMRAHADKIRAILPTVTGGAATNLQHALRHMALGDKKKARGSVALAYGNAKRMGNAEAAAKLRKVLDGCKACAAPSKPQRRATKPAAKKAATAEAEPAPASGRKPPKPVYQKAVQHGVFSVLPQTFERPAKDALVLLRSLEWSISTDVTRYHLGSAWSWDGKIWYATNGHTLARFTSAVQWGDGGAVDLSREAVRATLSAIRKGKAEKVRFAYEGGWVNIGILRTGAADWHPIGAFRDLIANPPPVEQVIVEPQGPGRVAVVDRKKGAAELRAMFAQIKQVKSTPTLVQPSCGDAGCSLQVRSTHLVHKHQALASLRVDPGTYYLEDGTEVQAKDVEGQIKFFEGERPVSPHKLWTDAGSHPAVHLQPVGPGVPRGLQPVGISLAYLLDAIAYAPEDQTRVAISVAGPLDPVRVDAGPYTAIVMPMRQ